MLEKLPDMIGHALHNRRAGLDKIAFNLTDMRGGTGAISVSSLAFNDYGAIPAKYTADGEGASPPLAWTGIPAEAESLALIVEDADAPTPHPLVHAIVVALPPHDGQLQEGVLNTRDVEGEVGRNSYLQTKWLPPDPPPGHSTHRYAFQLFALGAGSAFDKTPGREALLEAIRERGIASGCLIGIYERPDGSIKVDAANPVEADVAGPVKVND